MRKNRSNQGFSLAEVLAAVAILAVLAGVSFVGVQSHARSMKLLELDGVAREIFVAAQNHLTVAESQGYLGRTNFGAEEKTNGTVTVPEDGVWYFVIGGESTYDLVSGADEDSVLNLMLPDASLDDAVRLSGSYIVRYHKDSGQMLDVFYTEKSGRYGYTLDAETDYASLVNMIGGEGFGAARRNYTDGAAVGYYGGAEAKNLTQGDEINAPRLRIDNAERLTATVTDTNDLSPHSKLKMYLAVTGRTSKKTKTIELKPGMDATVAHFVKYNLMTSEYTIVLDDVTTAGLHFSELFGSAGLIPGEDVAVKVNVENTEQLAAGQFKEETVNSLFGDAQDADIETDKTAYIQNIRHLENLSADVSSRNMPLEGAIQTNDLYWFGDQYGFVEQIKAANGVTSVGVIASGRASSEDHYLPVAGLGSFTYDGGGCTIVGVTVSGDTDAGLFQSLTNCTVKDLRLEGFTVETTSGSAGALAGSVSNGSGDAITGVLACGSTGSITAPGSAGGLIGSLSGGAVRDSAAAVYVTSATGAAGGLIGSAENASISGSYAGGHTNQGAYKNNAATDRYEDNVRSDGGNAGGLIGTLSGGSVDDCYATCSVAGAAFVGGLVGDDSGATIRSSYATGLIGGEASIGAFAGSVSEASLVENQGNQYYEIINYDAGVPAVGGSDISLEKLDENLEAYRAAVPIIGTAKPYDSQLGAYYDGKYALRSVNTIDRVVHYGDWPAPETLVVNIAS